MRTLEGLRVIDRTQVMAGPFCSMLLGDMGTDTDAVLAELGYGADDIAGLRAKGVV